MVLKTEYLLMIRSQNMEWTDYVIDMNHSFIYNHYLSIYRTALRNMSQLIDITHDLDLGQCGDENNVAEYKIPHSMRYALLCRFMLGMANPNLNALTSFCRERHNVVRVHIDIPFSDGIIELQSRHSLRVCSIIHIVLTEDTCH